MAKLNKDGTPAKKRGPKNKIIDPELVEKLASIFCTQEEIGHIVGCSVDTLVNKFSEAIKKGNSNGKMSIKRKQFELAVKKGNPTMLIWLGKIYLGQKEDQSNLDRPIKVEITNAEAGL